MASVGCCGYITVFWMPSFNEAEAFVASVVLQLISDELADCAVLQ